MRFFAGVDPDMHNMPIAVVDEAGVLQYVRVVEVPKKITGRPALVEMMKQTLMSGPLPLPLAGLCVEAQEIYQHGSGKTKNPKSIMFLATVAGIAMTTFNDFLTMTYFPTPQEWKGSVPKQIHQARVLSKMGIGYNKHGTVEDGYCWPVGLCQFDVKPAHWKHVVDAIGLAQWGREKFLAEDAFNKRKECKA